MQEWSCHWSLNMVMPMSLRQCNNWQATSGAVTPSLCRFRSISCPYHILSCRCTGAMASGRHSCLNCRAAMQSFLVCNKGDKEGSLGKGTKEACSVSVRFAFPKTEVQKTAAGKLAGLCQANEPPFAPFCLCRQGEDTWQHAALRDKEG